MTSGGQLDVAAAPAFVAATAVVTAVVAVVWRVHGAIGRVEGAVGGLVAAVDGVVAALAVDVPAAVGVVPAVVGVVVVLVVLNVARDADAEVRLGRHDLGRHDLVAQHPADDLDLLLEHQPNRGAVEHRPAAVAAVEQLLPPQDPLFRLGKVPHQLGGRGRRVHGRRGGVRGLHDPCALSIFYSNEIY